LKYHRFTNLTIGQKRWRRGWVIMAADKEGECKEKNAKKVLTEAKI
jgi:hypothetical protein